MAVAQLKQTGRLLSVCNSALIGLGQRAQIMAAAPAIYLSFGISR